MKCRDCYLKHYNRSSSSSQSDSCRSKQELFAVPVMCVISRTRLAAVSEVDVSHTPEFNNTIIFLQMDATLFRLANPEIGLLILCKLLDEIATIKNSDPKDYRKSYTIDKYRAEDITHRYSFCKIHQPNNGKFFIRH